MSIQARLVGWGWLVALPVVINVAFPAVSAAQCTGASPRWTSSADFASVSGCVSRAKSGDTITVSGSAVWTETLMLTRGLTLVGSGDVTITGRRRLIQWVPSAEARAAHDTLTIQGFTFDGDNASFQEMGYAGVLVVSSGSGGHVRLVVRFNTFRNLPDSIRGLYLQGDVFGVASSNTFDRVGIALGVYGNDYDSWASYPQAYGTADTFYFEDNLIRFSSYFNSGHAGFVTSGQGGRVVVRYNSWDYANVPAPGEFWDVHGLQGPASAEPVPTGCTNYSSMMTEYYGNRITGQVNAYRWTQHRGGWLMMFFNSLTGNTSPYNGVTQYFCNACQARGTFNQKADNTYAWRNLANGVEKPLEEYSPGAAPYGCTSDPLVENADYFNYRPQFEGTAGVGCGPLAARPSTCAPGVAFWATTQSCSDLNGMIGAKPATPISGTLYRCTSPNTWSAYYTPLAYPHPLMGPQAPRNVLVKQP